MVRVNDDVQKCHARCYLRGFQSSPELLEPTDLDIVENIGFAFTLQEASQVGPHTDIPFLLDISSPTFGDTPSAVQALFK